MEATLGVGEQQAPSGEQPSSVVQPTGEAAQEAQGGPPAGQAPSGPSPPQPALGPQPAAAPAPPIPEPVPESDATLREQQAALLDPTNAREAMIYPKGVKPFALPDQTRYGQTKLKDGRVVQYDKQGPNALTPKKIGAYARSDRLNQLLQLGPVPQTEAVQQSVAGAAEPAVVTERAPSSVPGEPGVDRKAAEGTTATAPAQAEALEATKTPDSMVQVETHAETLGDRFKKARDEAIAARQAEAAQAEPPAPAPKEAASLGKMMLTQADKKALRDLGHSDEAISHMTPNQGADIIARGERAAPESPTTPRVEPVKMAETKSLSVWDRGDGTYFKRYADGREVPITKTVADLLAKNEPYVPAQKLTAQELIDARTEKPPEQPRRILQDVSDEGQEAAARQAEADRAAAEKVAAELAAAPKAKPEPKPKAEQQPKKRGEKADDELRRINQVAKDVVAAHPPQGNEALAAIAGREKGSTWARKALLERVIKMVQAAKDAGYKFMRPLRERVGDTNHPNEGILLHEAELLTRKKVMKTENARRFLWAEDALLNKG